MAHSRCVNCGCFRPPVVDTADLFDAPLPFPAADDPFLRIIRESQKRERHAIRRQHKQAIGAERQARAAFTLRCLQPLQGASHG